MQILKRSGKADVFDATGGGKIREYIILKLLLEMRAKEGSKHIMWREGNRESSEVISIA